MKIYRKTLLSTVNYLLKTRILFSQTFWLCEQSSNRKFCCYCEYKPQINIVFLWNMLNLAGTMSSNDTEHASSYHRSLDNVLMKSCSRCPFIITKHAIQCSVQMNISQNVVKFIFLIFSIYREISFSKPSFTLSVYDQNNLFKYFKLS